MMLLAKFDCFVEDLFCGRVEPLDHPGVTIRYKVKGYLCSHFRENLKKICLLSLVG